MGTTLSPSPYGRAQEEGREALRRAVVEAAATILAEAGPEGLTMRRLAQAIGASTKVLYTHFGNKHGVAEALHLDGFERLHAAMAGVPVRDDHFQHLVEVGLAYRRFALDQPTRYGVMFQHAIAGFEPSAEAIARARRALQVFVDAVAACVADGVLTGDPEVIAEVLWAAGHGAVSLELSGYFPEPEAALQRFTATTGAVVWAFRTEQARWLL